MIPQIIAHRGNRSVAPENTLVAFASAIEAGAQSLELDIVRALDGTAVIVHDETLDATTSGTGNVADCSVPEIQALDAGSWFNSAYAGVTVPTLQEFGDYMRLYPHVEILLEFKGDWDVEQARSVVQTLDRAGLEEQSILQSFNKVTVESLAQVAPDYRRGVLFISRDSQERMGWGGENPSGYALSDLSELIQSCVAGGIYTLNPFVEDIFLKPSLVEDLHRAGLRTQVWTANEPEQWDRLAELGVDAIITDRPDALAGWYAGKGLL